MADKQIVCDVLKVFDEKKGRIITRIQVIRWGAYSPVLEKRDYYLKDEEERTGKVKGLNNEDFQILIDNADEIQDLLEKEFKPKSK